MNCGALAPSRFALLEAILDETREFLDSRDATSPPLLFAHLKSLRSISNADWQFLIEPLIALDSFLRLDPAGSFDKWTSIVASSTASG